jgi:transposase
MQTSLIGLEACSGARFLGRALRKQGHDVRLIAAQFVKPFVKSNKNDFVDAEAIAERISKSRSATSHPSSRRMPHRARGTGWASSNEWAWAAKAFLPLITRSI